MSSADNLYKHLDLDQVSKSVGPDLDPNHLTVFQKEVLEKSLFQLKLADDKIAIISYLVHSLIISQSQTPEIRNTVKHV